MRWTCDLSVGALYFELTDEPIASQRVVDDGLIVDYDAAGGVVGMEALGDTGRVALLGNAVDLGLTQEDVDLIVAVVFSQVDGDRAELGIVESPATESRDKFADSPVLLDLQEA